jgi:hypothetical protein
MSRSVSTHQQLYEGLVEGVPRSRTAWTSPWRHSACDIQPGSYMPFGRSSRGEGGLVGVHTGYKVTVAKANEAERQFWVVPVSFRRNCRSALRAHKSERRTASQCRGYLSIVPSQFYAVHQRGRDACGIPLGQRCIAAIHLRSSERSAI